MNQPQSETLDLIQQMFDQADLDGSGTIDLDELIQMMGATGFNDLIEEVQGIFQKVDVNGDGQIDLAEFRQYIASL